MRRSAAVLIGMAVLMTVACARPVIGSAAPAPIPPALAGLAAADPCSLLPAAEYRPSRSSTPASGDGRTCQYLGTDPGVLRSVFLYVLTDRGLAETRTGGSELIPMMVAGYRAQRYFPLSVQSMCSVEVGITPDLMLQVRVLSFSKPGSACTTAEHVAGLVITR